MAEKKDFLEKRFRHHKWFKEGVTVRYALDYFAKSGDFYLCKKESKQESDSLFPNYEYDDVLRYIGRDTSTYRLSQEEKDFFLERVEFWQEERAREHKEWLAQPINVDFKFRLFVAGNSNYDIKYVENNLTYWNTKGKDDDAGHSTYWKKEKDRRIITKKVIDDVFEKMKLTIKTNQDFLNFQQTIEKELDEVQYWDENKADYVLRDCI